MPATLSASGLLADLAQRGVSLRAVAGKIVVMPASRLTPQDRETIGNRRAELLAILSPCEPWNVATALQLMDEADALVERLGILGQHPAIADAAAMVTGAFATRDMETLRFAVSEFALVVRKLTKPRDSDPEQQRSA